MKKEIPFTPFCFDSSTRLFNRRNPIAIIKECGGEYMGHQKVPGHEGFFNFMDPITGTLLGIEPSRTTHKNVKRKIKESRKKFRERDRNFLLIVVGVIIFWTVVAYYLFF